MLVFPGNDEIRYYPEYDHMEGDNAKYKVGKAIYLASYWCDPGGKLTLKHILTDDIFSLVVFHIRDEYMCKTEKEAKKIVNDLNSGKIEYREV